MKIRILALIVCTIFVFVACSNLQNNNINLDTVELPIASIDGVDGEIVAAFYEGGFDFKYENLPELTTTKNDVILKIKLPNTFSENIELEENYYSYSSNAGTSTNITHDLIKDEKGEISLDVTRVGKEREEQAVYFLSNQQGSFVFELIFAIE